MRFAKGDIGMFYWWSAYFYLCRKDGYMSGKDSVIADKIGIVPLPHSDAPQVGSIGGWSLGIAANSAQQDEAWTFVKWATSAKAQKAMALYDKYGHQFADFARRSLYDDPELLKIYPYLPEQLRGIEIGNGKVGALPGPDLHHAGEHLRPQPQSRARRQHVAGTVRRGNHHAVDQRAQGEFHDPLFAGEL